MPSKEIESSYPYLRLNEDDVECSECHKDAIVLTVCCKEPLCSSCADDGITFTRRGNVKVDCQVDPDCPPVKVRLPVGQYNKN